VRRHHHILLVFALVGLSTATLAAADLTDAALRAWAEYLGRHGSRFSILRTCHPEAVMPIAWSRDRDKRSSGPEA
jgi:hypothetical protein